MFYYTAPGSHSYKREISMFCNSIFMSSFTTQRNRTNRVIKFDWFIKFGNRTHRKVPVRLCSIAEPIERQSNDWSSIEFSWVWGEVEGDRGLEVYGRREKRRWEAGFPRRREVGEKKEEITQHCTIFCN